MKATPLRQVTEKFGGKDKLLDAVVAAIVAVGGGEESKDDLRKRLRGVSNRKLVHLEAILGQVQARFGGRDKLVDAILVLQGRTKDADYRRAVSSCSPSRLLDLHRASERRSKRAKAA